MFITPMQSREDLEKQVVTAYVVELQFNPNDKRVIEFATNNGTGTLTSYRTGEAREVVQEVEYTVDGAVLKFERANQDDRPFIQAILDRVKKVDPSFKNLLP